MINPEFQQRLKQLEELEIRQVYLRCPKCLTNAVGLNCHDYYECRDCQVQYTTCADGERIYERVLLFKADGDYIPVLVLPNKGEGKFPMDKTIEDLRQAIEKAGRSKRRG